MPAIANNKNRIVTYLEISLSDNQPEAKAEIAPMPIVIPRAEAAMVADILISVMNETSCAVTALYPIDAKAKLIPINHKAGLFR
jgi:hypothetical protein